MHCRLLVWILVSAVSVSQAHFFPLLAGSRTSRSPATPGFFHFVDVGRKAGLTFQHINGGQGKKYLIETMGAGGGFLDYDNDGWVDIYLVQSGPHQRKNRPGNQLYRNQGDGTFAPIPESAGASDRGYGMGCTFGDIDNDGWIDIYVTNFGPNVLLRNRGDGTFEDLSVKAGVADPSWSTSAAFADVNQDGFLDLYVANYLTFSYENHIQCGDVKDPSYCHPDVYDAAPNTFYLNNGDGTFREATAEIGLVPKDTAASKSLGVLFFDMEGDGDLDLYVANDSTANFLFENQANHHYEDISVISGTAYNMDGKTEAGMGIAGGDAFGNGRIDLIVTHLDFETNTFYANDGEGMFSDQTDSTGLGGPSKTRVGFGINLRDFNNDGWPDLFVANGHVIDNIERENPSLSHAQPNQLFFNTGESFREISSEAGEYFQHPSVSRGSAVADFDQDGDLDILVTNNGGPAELLENDGEVGTWIQFLLRGRSANRNAIGARVRVMAGKLSQIQEVRSADSYCSQSDLRLHFGLGSNRRVDLVEILWPGGGKQIIRNPAINRLHRITQGKKRNSR